MGVSVHGKDTFRCGIVNNAVRVFIGFGLADRLKGLQVENDDFALAPVRDESAAKLRRHRDSVVLFQAGDVADQGAAIGVDYFNLRAVRQVNTTGRRVYGNVVKILAGAPLSCAERVFLDLVVPSCCRHRQDKSAEQNKGNADCNPSDFK